MAWSAAKRAANVVVSFRGSLLSSKKATIMTKPDPSFFGEYARRIARCRSRSTTPLLLIKLHPYPHGCNRLGALNCRLTNCRSSINRNRAACSRRALRQVSPESFSNRLTTPVLAPLAHIGMAELCRRNDGGSPHPFSYRLGFAEFSLASILGARSVILRPVLRSFAVQFRLARDGEQAS